jgi:hypothetical protein
MRDHRLAFIMGEAAVFSLILSALVAALLA